MIIYQGPSLIDGAPIVVIAVAKSGNGKTGDMVQTYIIRADMDPRLANKTGQDFSICGKCVHRGTPSDELARKLAKGRTCYVTIAQGPLAVFRKFKRGGYPVADSADARASIGEGRMVRLGTYGDPAAAPAYVWRELLSLSVGHTGYSHQMDLGGAQFDAKTMMVSADSLEHAKRAWQRGARTFRIVSRDEWKSNGMNALEHGKEVLCPASKEAGYKSTCNDCGLCSGTSSRSTRSVAIVAHGASANLIARVAA